MSETVRQKALTVGHALRVINLESLQVDPSYQRDIKRKVAKIIAEFDEEALGIPVVGEREDLSLWIVDGLQRITALRKMQRKSLRCEIFKSRGPEHEAQVFKLINMNRTRLKPAEEFRALLTAHDEGAWAIKEAVERAGFRIAINSTGSQCKNVKFPEQACKDLVCISALVEIYLRGYLPSLEAMLPIILECWPLDLQATRREIIWGLTNWHNRRDGVFDRERLIHNLRTITPYKLIYITTQFQLGNNSGRGSIMAEQIEKVYRKRIVKPK